MAIRSERLLKKRRNRHIIRIVLISVGVCIVLALPIVLFNLHVFLIRDVTVSGNIGVSEDSIQSVVQADLLGRYGHIIPRSNVLFFPKQKIKTDVLNISPRISSATVTIQGLHAVHIAITERAPNALWCVNDGNSDCYFIDETGKIFDHAPVIQGSLYLIFTGGVDTSRDILGQQFTSLDEYRNVQSFIHDIMIMGLTPVSVHVLLAHEYDVMLEGGEHILFTTRLTVDESISNLESMFADPKLSLKNGTTLSFSSLDLRYGNKVFFKDKSGQ